MDRKAFSHQNALMRTTLDIPDPLFREVKARAARQGLKLKELLTAYIEAGLRRPVVENPEGTPRVRSPLPVSIPRDPAAVPVRARTNAELHEILDEEDAAGHRRAPDTQRNQT